MATIVRRYDVPEIGEVRIVRDNDDQKRDFYMAEYDIPNGNHSYPHYFAESDSEDKTIQLAGIEVEERLTKKSSRLKEELRNVDGALQKMKLNSMRGRLLEDFIVKEKAATPQES
jgi:hypothetical protein